MFVLKVIFLLFLMVCITINNDILRFLLISYIFFLDNQIALLIVFYTILNCKSAMNNADIVKEGWLLKRGKTLLLIDLIA